MSLPSSNALSAAQYTAASTMFQQFFTANQGQIPAVVRLAFHSCVGGCNGCINLNLAANRGLNGIVGQLETLYASGQYSTIMSRADFWALGSVVALGVASTGQAGGPLPLQFAWGRVDCPTAPTTSAVGDFPAGMGNMSEVQRVFVTGEFQLTTAQTVALLGAHSLGGATIANSGFAGPWAPPVTVFSNKFFRALANGQYSHGSNAPASPNTQQFSAQGRNGGGRLMMLHTDMALLKSFPVQTDGSGAVTGVQAGGCVVSNNAAAVGSYNSVAGCPNAPTAGLVQTYATNQAAFFSDFSVAFTRMISHAPGSGASFALFAPGSGGPFVPGPTTSTATSSTASTTTTRTSTATRTTAATTTNKPAPSSTTTKAPRNPPPPPPPPPPRNGPRPGPGPRHRRARGHSDA